MGRHKKEDDIDLDELEIDREEEDEENEDEETLEELFVDNTGHVVEGHKARYSREDEYEPDLLYDDE